MDSIKSITPASATVVLDRYGYRRVPVVLQEVGTPDGGRTQVVPATVVVAGAQTAVAQVMAAQATLSYPADKGAVLMELHPLPVDAQLRPVAGVTVDPPLVRATIAVPKVTKAQ